MMWLTKYLKMMETNIEVTLEEEVEAKVGEAEVEEVEAKVEEVVGEEETPGEEAQEEEGEVEVDGAKAQATNNNNNTGRKQSINHIAFLTNCNIYRDILLHNNNNYYYRSFDPSHDEITQD
mmetsp:Transcript_929/g.1006  ORF Transcript_929/g.1006 Transcript_929/m.1006 type:complete len:121 (-) Transcript_929:34-396(-)